MDGWLGGSLVGGIGSLVVVETGGTRKGDAWTRAERGPHQVTHSEYQHRHSSDEETM